MKITEATKCPNCGAEGRIYSIDVLFDDTRYDTLQCPECGAEWQAFYKISDVSAQILSMPEKRSQDVPNFEEIREPEMPAEEVFEVVEVTEE